MTTVQINGQIYKFRYCLGARFVFEKLTDEPMDLTKTQHQCLLFYAMLTYGDKDFNFDMPFEDFLDWLDEGDHFDTLGKKLIAQIEAKEVFNRKAEKETKDKKKV